MNLNAREYIEKILAKGYRSDKRKLDELRKVKIEYDVSKNAEGSARVILGDTEVIVGVKLDMGTPFPDSADEGVLIVTAELLPLSSEKFESGPPGAQATELARVVDRGIRESKAIDVKKLCITEGEKVWMVFLDIYTINDGGNLIDAAALGAMAALHKAVFPKIENDRVKFGEFTKDKLPMVKTPITCTLTKIGKHILVDAKTDEEEVCDARLSIAINEDGKINAMQKGGETALTLGEIDTMVGLAVKKSKEFRKVLEGKK